MRVSRLAAAAAVLAALALPARAQHLGDVSISTVSQTLFPAGTACTGAAQTAVINNLGQTSHSLYVNVTAGVPTKLTYFLEGSNDGAIFTRISDETDGNVLGQLQASGYFTVVRANITCAPAVTTTFSMTYGGSGVPQAQPAGDGLRAQMEKTLANGTSTGTSQSGFVRAPYGNLSGLLLIGSTGVFPGGSSITLTCTYVNGSGTPQTFALSGSSGLFPVVQSPCALVSWNYTAGGASGATLVIEYIFSTGFSGAGGNGTGGGAVTSTNVQGTTANGALGTGINPVLVSGLDPLNGNNLRANVYPPGEVGTDGNGLALGDAASNGVSGTYTNAVTTPNGNAGGPLVVAPYVPTGNGTSQGNLKKQRGGGGVTSNGEQPGGLYTHDSGYLFRFTGLVVTTTQTVALWNDSSGSGDFTVDGPIDSCRIDINPTTITGTTPTLDVFLQDGYNDTLFTDRIHLAQFTTVTGAVYAATNPNASITSKAYQNRTLAASTNVDGKMGTFGQLALVVGGTTPSYTLDISVVCK